MTASFIIGVLNRHLHLQYMSSKLVCASLVLCYFEFWLNNHKQSDKLFENKSNVSVIFFYTSFNDFDKKLKELIRINLNL